jgi:hypothetical protein
MIPLRDWNSYFKKLYKSLDVHDDLQTLCTKEEVFSVEDIKFGVKHFSKGKAKDIEGYQT